MVILLRLCKRVDGGSEQSMAVARRSPRNPGSSVWTSVVTGATSVYLSPPRRVRGPGIVWRVLAASRFLTAVPK